MKTSIFAVFAMFFISANAYSKIKFHALGDSLTEGSVSASYVDILKKKLGDDYLVSNFGINGNLSYNLLGRVAPIADDSPEIATILIGTNDIYSQFAPLLYLDKKVPKKPIADQYERNLRDIINSFSSDTRIMLISVPPIGEILDSKHNQLVGEINDVIRKLANEFDLTYIPFSESLVDRLENTKRSNNKCGPMKFTTLSAGAKFKRSVLKQSWNKISKANGFSYTVDCLHINEKAANILVDEIMERI